MTATVINLEKLIASGYNVSEIDSGMYVVDNFITENECKTLYDFASSLTEDQWKQSYIINLKKMAKNSFGTDDLDALAKERKIIINEKLLDKTVSISPEIFPSGVKKSLQNQLWGMAIELSDRLKKFVSKYPIRPFAVIQRHYPGVGLDEHVDQKNDPCLRFACIIYLNDNYNGGELYFPYRGIRIKPAARSLVIFDASDEYLHGVDIVEDGPTRYAMTSFIWDSSVQ